MTPQEAINDLKTVHSAYDVMCGDWSFCWTAIEALEKQIPKKPKPLITGIPNDYSVCPSCDCAFHSVEGVVYLHYCPRCGQAIDWESDNK